MISDLLFGVIVPASLAVAVLLARWRATSARTERGSTPSRGLVGAAWGIAIIAAFIGLEGWPGFVPAERWQRLLHLAVLATVVAVFVDVTRTPRWLIGALALAVAAMGAVLVQPPANPEHAIFSPLVLAASIVVLWTALATLATRRAGLTLPVTLVVVFSGASVVLLQSRNATMALLSASLAAASGAAVVLGAIHVLRSGGANRDADRARLALAPGAAVVVAALLPALLFSGARYDYGAVPTLAFALIAAAPLLLLFGEVPSIGRLPAWAAVVVRVIPVVVAVAIAIALALGAAPADPYASLAAPVTDPTG